MPASRGMTRRNELEPALDGRMGFWDHVEALRKVLLASGFVVLAFTGVYFALMPWIFDSVILAPCSFSFPTYRLIDRLAEAAGYDAGATFRVNLINIKLASQFFIHMSSSFWLGVVTAFPVVIYLLWRFVAPGLYPGERRGAKSAFLFGNAMFFLGVAIGYFIVFPLTLRFLAEYKVSEFVPNQISLDSYMDNFIVLILVMGLVFELPLLAWMLGRAGFLTRSFFKSYSRHAIAGLLILAALITPTGDPFTLLVVFLPLYMLWLLSARMVPAESTRCQ